MVNLVFLSKEIGLMCFTATKRSDYDDSRNVWSG